MYTNIPNYFKILLPLLFFLSGHNNVFTQTPSFTANDQVTPYNGPFQYGTNMGYSLEQLPFDLDYLNIILNSLATILIFIGSNIMIVWAWLITPCLSVILPKIIVIQLIFVHQNLG